jgi:tRNA (guanosine-2'-O-)-methyltransferase
MSNSLQGDGMNGSNTFAEAVISHLGQYVTDKRRDAIERVLHARTRYLTIVLEDIYQSHNASAVVRTC